MNRVNTLYLDFDCTLVNTIKSIVSLYNEDFKYYKKYEYIHWTDVRTWDFLECNCAKPEYINTYFNQQRFFDSLFTTSLYPSGVRIITLLYSPFFKSSNAVP